MLMLFKRVGQRLWYGATCWQTVLVLCYGLANSVDMGSRGLRKQTTFRDATDEGQVRKFHTDDVPRSDKCF